MPYRKNYILRDRTVFYEEFGAGAYLKTRHGELVAEFQNHLDAEVMIAALERSSKNRSSMHRVEEFMESLSETSLNFLVERCDFSEPWCGFGFATSLREAIQAALEKKKGAANEQS